MSSANLVEIGQVFAGKYRVEKVLGRGGMGVVFAALHIELEQPVAIKMLLPDLTSDEQVVKRFVREAKAAAKIGGEHIARVFDVGRLPDGVPYIVLERLVGCDLSVLLEGRGHLPVSEAADYVIEAAHALAQAHGAGIVHRDIKPSNLFLADREDGVRCVKVLDFGISKLMVDTPTEDNMTATKEVIGSPRYMSPEQLRASRDVDSRTDIWSLGVVLYELLSGSTPFAGSSPMVLGAAILHKPPRSLREKRPEVPPAVEEIVLKCLEKSPVKRFAKMCELVDALKPFATTRGRQVADAVSRVTARSLPASSPSLVDEAEASFDEERVDSTADTEKLVATQPNWAAGPSITSRTTRFRRFAVVGGAAIVVTLVAGSVLAVKSMRAVATARPLPPPTATESAPFATGGSVPVTTRPSSEPDPAEAPSAQVAAGDPSSSLSATTRPRVKRRPDGRGTQAGAATSATANTGATTNAAAPTSSSIVRDRHGGE